jgi:uncharacterized membrane protein
MAEEKKVKSGGEVEEGKVYAIVGYLGILFLIPLLALPKNKFAQYHARQGMVLFFVELAVYIVAMVLAMVTLGIGALLYPIASIVGIVWSVLGIINAANGEMKPLPLIGSLAGKLGSNK